MAAKAQTSKSPGKAPKKMLTPPMPVLTANMDDEDEDSDAAMSSSSSAPKPEEATTPLTTKNFRNHPDMENFFRFIHDNDLRLEALQIIDEILLDRKAKKAKR